MTTKGSEDVDKTRVRVRKRKKLGDKRERKK